MYIALSYELARACAWNFAALYMNLITYAYVITQLIVRVIITSQIQEFASW